MRVNPNDLLHLIDRDGYVAIDGLGLIYKIHQKASFDFRNNTLKAPNDKLGFSEVIFEKENLRDYLSSNYAISLKKAAAKVELLVEDIISEILKNGSYSLDEIGVINRKKGDIEFEPMTRRYSGLPILNVSPIHREPEKKAEKIKEVIKENAMPTYDYSREEKSNFSWIKYLIPLFLILACILLWRSCQSDKVTNPSDRLADSGIEQSETIKQNDGTIKIVDESDTTLISDPDNVEEIGDLNSEGNTPSRDRDLDDVLDRIEEKSDSEENLDDYNVESIALYQECIIIAGTFGKAKNVLRMMDKIQKLNLEVYDETLPNGLTRVGFKFDGSQKNLPQYLREMRKTLGKGAWYLEPPMEVY